MAKDLSRLSTALLTSSNVLPRLCTRCLGCQASFRSGSAYPAPRRTMSSTPRLRSLNIDNINPNVKNAQYAVRGELAVRAEKYRQQLHNDPPTPPSDGESLPFNTVISANIGNPQQLDQKPITFFRQVTSLLENPELLKQEKLLIELMEYKPDVFVRAKKLLDDVKSVGAYSQSQGAPGIRSSVAKFIEKRDGFPADPNDIYLSTGASAGVNTLLTLIRSSPKTGVLVPIPQYPLYTATLSVLNGVCVPYYLDEAHSWSTNLESIRSAISKAKAEGTDVRAIVVINPGNPTGAVLRESDLKDILSLAADERLVVLGDEVYQTNVFPGQPPFCSFKKALRICQSETEPRDNNKYTTLELASLHSISKGMVGECGHRGGYMELIGFDPEVVAQLYKFVSISLCPPVIGQCIVEMMVNPPQEGDPSYELYKKEYDGIFSGLHERAQALYHAFKDMEGVSCQDPMGSMYLFPSIRLPKKAIEAAKEKGKVPDEFYVSRLLDATGICMVPGSGFGQEEGTFHFRTTFLAPGTEWVDRIRKFHKEFMAEFAE